MSAHVDRETGWKRVPQSATPFIAFLKGAMLSDAPGAQQRRKGRCDGCDKELLVFSEKSVGIWKECPIAVKVEEVST